MKIVMFTDAYWPRVNGVTVSVDSFSHALLRAGHEVLIVCSFYPDAASVERIASESEHEHPNVYVPGERKSGEPEVIRVPSMPLFLSKEDRLAKLHKWFWVSKQIDLFAPDILHINSEFVIAEFGFQYARRNNLPAVYTFHTLWEDYAVNYFPMVPVFLLKFFARRYLKYVINKAYLIIVPTVQIREVIKKYNIKKQIHLLPTGIDPRIFEHERAEVDRFRNIMEQKYPALKGKRILLFAGRIAKEKNLDFLLALVPRIREKHPETVFLFVGNGPDLSYFQKECEEQGIEEHCVFTGYLSRQDLALTYAISHIFVFPSLTETQGLVTIEAMLSGTPVVAIGEMGTIMVMGGNNGGFMVKNDPEEFTRRVFDLLEDPDLYQRKAAEAKVHAKAWTIDSLTEKLVQIYRAAIKSFPPKKS
ncbi:MAG: glycosyltransferase [Spirochaetaceae bacterium]|jgi:glycosyltransferase involved in cell wall biosynthesis|nr:glycosyltransferase [Spirochaetaceae bacterium]